MKVTKNFSLCEYFLAPPGRRKKDNVEETENSEVKQFFGLVELQIKVTDNGKTDVVVEIVF